MNKNLMDDLGEALKTADAAFDAAQSGAYDDARTLLAKLDGQLDAAQGGSAAHGQRRAKVLRVRGETLALLADQPVPDVTPDWPAQSAGSPVAALTGAGEGSAAQDPAPTPAAAQEVAEQPATEPDEPAAKVRGVAAPHSMSAEQWGRVAAALRAEGVTAEQRDEDENAALVRQTRANEARQRHAAKVAEREALQARVDACALRGDVEGANRAWDRLFDVVTALRSSEGTARRKGLADQPAKAAAYEAAREANLRLRRWARGADAA